MGLAMLEFYLSCAAAGLEVRKWRCVPAHPIPLVFTLPVSFSHLWRRIRRNSLGVRKRVKSLLCDCIRPDLPFG